MSSPIVDFKSCGRYRVRNIYAGDANLNVPGWTIFVVVVKEPLNRPTSNTLSNVTKDRRALMKRRLHVTTSPGGSIDVLLKNDHDLIAIGSAG